MDKAPDAFRTISEVADDLDIPQHVLRFWETRFAQIKPMKRSGGRRYYRPDDVDLLARHPPAAVRRGLHHPRRAAHPEGAWRQVGAGAGRRIGGAAFLWLRPARLRCAGKPMRERNRRSRPATMRLMRRRHRGARLRPQPRSHRRGRAGAMPASSTRAAGGRAAGFDRVPAIARWRAEGKLTPIVIPGRAEREPGIHNHDWGLWIPGLRQGAHPGMTRLGTGAPSPSTLLAPRPERSYRTGPSRHRSVAQPG